MYKTLKEINFFEDESLRASLQKLSILIVVVPSFIFGFLFALHLEGNASIMGEFSRIGFLFWLVLLIVITLVLLPVHELVHASYFKLFHPKAHIVFGFKDAMLYAGCPGEVFTRRQMCIILLAPAIEISVLLAIFAFITGAPVLCISAAVLHLSGCSGDILAARSILCTKECTHCQDTDYGIDLLA